ncbi:hypothetical protein [Luteimonas salinilitoris]|uniref:Uncharacterized protein n=1 Tax=Luteimonas salinilitoris TaxID=3237697 RepID=A0ABV4HUJ8_9GAMM
MSILGEGRPAFLEFLRNLTPQALILAVTLTALSRLDLSTWDLGNWKNTVIFYLCFSVWMLSLIANTIQFIESYSEASLKPINAVMAKSRRLLKTSRQSRAMLWRLLKRNKWRVMLNIMLSTLVAQIGMAAAMAWGIQQGLQIVRSMQ